MEKEEEKMLTSCGAATCLYLSLIFVSKYFFFIVVGLQINYCK